MQQLTATHSGRSVAERQVVGSIAGSGDRIPIGRNAKHFSKISVSLSEERRLQ